jgi:glycosyltransferase involved in cell wall biosynthesis
MKIVILSKYNEQGSSSRYRFYNFSPYFDTNGISYEFKPLLPESYVAHLYQGKRFVVFFQQIIAIIQRLFFLMFFLKKCDLILIEKELLPNVPYFIEKLLLGKKAYALDFDDYTATDYKSHPVKKLFLFHKIDHLAQKAKFVTVGNKWYFDEIKSNNLCYLPTVVSLAKYRDIKKTTQPNDIQIVWIGSPSTSKYLAIVKNVLEKLSQKYPLVVNVIGGHFDSKKVKFNLIKWESETEIMRLLDSDIGIMPLEDTIWEKGKCGFKLIQYMACGLPVVASASPANFEIIEPGISGYIAQSESDWYDFLEMLIVDQNRRASFGLAGRRRVVYNYSYEVWGDRYCQIIKNSLSV